MSPIKYSHRALRDFAQDTRAVISAELVLVVPMLCWAFFATVVFNDAYRARTQAQAAALHVADAISRETNVLTMDYLEGMNDVYDFLIAGSQVSRLRITSVVWDRDADQPLVLWSYGTRGMTPLPANTFQLMAADDLGALRELMDGVDGTDLVAGFTQMPVEDLNRRIPPVMPGEALVLVESFTMWDAPVNGLFLGFNLLSDMRLSPIAVVRPRFSPFINFEGAMDAAPPDADEFDGTPYDPDADPDTPVIDPVEPTDPGAVVNVVSTDFTTALPAGFSSNKVTDSDTAGAGYYLGPFGRETRDDPVTYNFDFGASITQGVMDIGLLVFDGWEGYEEDSRRPEGEAIVVSINGESIAFQPFARKAYGLYGRTRQNVVSTEDGRFDVTFTLIESGVNYNDNSKKDQLWNLHIVATEPAQKLTLGFAAKLSGGRDDESFGISSMEIVGYPGDVGAGRFVPDAAARLGLDSLTGFAAYDGCPDRRLPAPILTLANSDLDDDEIWFERNVGGLTRLSTCSGFNQDGYLNASPTLLVDYENDTPNTDDYRLRLTTDDDDDGGDCDSTLLVRDPNGQFYFNDDRKRDDWNSRLDLGHAQSGRYTIWVGQYDYGTCKTDIIFELD